MLTWKILTMVASYFASEVASRELLPAQICKIKVAGVFPVKEDCSKYFQCVLGNIIYKQCPDHELFDIELWRCLLDDLVECRERKIIDVPSTSHLVDINKPLPQKVINKEGIGRCPVVNCFYEGNVKNLENLSPQQLNPNKCTHLYVMDAAELKDGKVVSNSDFHQGAVNAGQLLASLLDLKKTNPKLKMLFFVRSDDGSLVQTLGTTDDKLRSEFIASAISFARQHQFDGLSLQLARSSAADDTISYTKLLKFTMAALIKESQVTSQPRLTLSHVVRYGDEFYDIKEIHNYVDETIFGRQYLDSNCSHGKHHIAFKTMVKDIETWIDWGHPWGKLTIIIPFYGVYVGVDPQQTLKINSPCSGPSKSPLTGRDGVVPYSEACELINLYRPTTYYTYDSEANIYINSSHWLGYLDKTGVSHMVSTAIFKKLRGVTLNSLNYDDVKGTGCEFGPFPLWNQVIETCMTYRDL